MKTYCSWSNTEIKNLFDMVENYKLKNLPLVKAFEDYAKNSGRKCNSVRNYYYDEINELKNNEEKRKLLNIELKNHEISSPKNFSDAETKNLIEKINSQTKNGLSVRKACLNLAGGDATKMIRYQNKYREFLNKKQHSSNVVYMKRRESKNISEKDIDSLFLGLIKLVKKSASESIEKKLEKDLEFANSSLRKTLVKLNKAETELNLSLKNIKTLNLEIENLKNENQILRTEIANSFKPKAKTKKLSEFINEVKSKQKKIN